MLRDERPQRVGGHPPRRYDFVYCPRLEFKTKEGQAKGLARCKELGIDALVVIGGDGSFMGARALANQGIPCVGIPGTIDNDIACSEYTIGYDTAMNTAVEAIDKLRDTTQSHDRCSVVEVMGHHAGYIALNVGIATGALAVLLPERPFDFERDILQRMRQTQVTGKKHFIIIVSEGVTDAQTLANQIQALSDNCILTMTAPYAQEFLIWKTRKPEVLTSVLQEGDGSYPLFIGTNNEYAQKAGNDAEIYGIQVGVNSVQE